MKYQKSILSGHLADQLLANIATKNSGTVSSKLCNLLISGRHCTIKGARSGGFVLVLRSKNVYLHTSSRHAITYRLKAGWDRETLSKYIHKGVRIICDYDRISREREKVYKLAESRDLPDNIESTDRAIAYGDMSFDDCSYWLSKLDKYPEKAKQHEPS